MTAATLAFHAMNALRSSDDARMAAAMLWEDSGGDARLMRALMSFAEIDDAALDAYERTEPNRLVRGPWGDVWLCPREPGDRGILDGSWVTLRAMRAIGRGFADMILAPAPQAVDFEGNDFA